MSRNLTNSLPPLPDESRPRWQVHAPGRVNLIGEHVDYNDGWVLPMAIERGVVIRAVPQTGPVATFTTTLDPAPLHVDLRAPAASGGPPWGNYVRGVLAEFAESTGTTWPGFRAWIDTTLPPGGGLSSSAALTIAVATLLEDIRGQALPPMEKARLCQQVEHKYAGVPCGLMDQLAVTFGQSGHALLIDCTDHTTRPIPMADDRVVVLVTNTDVSHDLADGAYAERRRECREALEKLGCTSFRQLSRNALETGRERMGNMQYRRARHVLTEFDRTCAFAAALEQEDWETVGSLLYAGHRSLAEDYGVSCPELDHLVSAAQQLGPAGGVIGARMTGGGFGGCTITLAWRDRVAEVSDHLQGEFERAFGRKPECFVTRPADGARAVAPA